MDDTAFNIGASIGYILGYASIFILIFIGARSIFKKILKWYR